MIDGDDYHALFLGGDIFNNKQLLPSGSAEKKFAF